MLFRARTFVLAMLAAACVSPAFAQDAPHSTPAAGQSAWSVNDQGRVRLVSANSALSPAGQAEGIDLGLEFELQPGWKIYWRSPGDAGFPPSIDWKGSDNLADARFSWPVPHRFTVLGLQTMGYKNHVVLPIKARLTGTDHGLSLKASVDYLTCDVLCIPQHADLALDLPMADKATSNPSAHDISRALAQVPGDGARQGLGLISAQATADGALAVSISADPPLSDQADLFVERADQMSFGPPKVSLSQGGKRVDFVVQPVPQTGQGDLFTQPVTLTVADGERGMEITTPIARPQAASSLVTWVEMLAIALLGGFILNLMPCVLPVLSIKVLSVLSQGGAEQGHIRRGFLASAAGVMASFLLLAAGAVALKSAGAAVGWGIQFQHPLFLAAMILLLSLFAANLMGFFEIVLPHWLMAAGSGSGRQDSTLTGHFAAGAFATLLATPCSAPFLGTAIGFALARGPVEIVSIFTALGLGMALPYLAVAAWPKLAQRLPRPGRWMLTLRKALGVILLLTALWLVWVLWVQTSAQLALTVAVLMAALKAVLALGGKLPALARRGLAVLLAGAALVVAVEGDGAATVAVSGHHAPPAGLQGMWKPFDRDAIAKAVADGKVVFVDVTAEWCITCQVNKSAVVYRPPVSDRLTQSGVIAMQADWTRPDEAIAAYLASFGRYGIPFNAVYGPHAPDGIALPELLTADAVLQALDQAK